MKERKNTEERMFIYTDKTTHSNFTVKSNIPMAWFASIKHIRNSGLHIAALYEACKNFFLQFLCFYYVVGLHSHH